MKICQILKPEHQILKPEGRILKPERQFLKPDGRILEPERQFLKPEGRILKPERPIIKPEGRILKPERSIINQWPSHEGHRVNNHAFVIPLEPRGSAMRVRTTTDPLPLIYLRTLHPPRVTGD